MERKTNINERAKKEKRFIESGANIYVAFSEGMPCGIMSFSASRDTDLPNYAEIVSIHTLESVGGEGVGKELIEFALSELKRRNYKNVLLWVFEANVRARRFYEKNGFIADGSIRDSGFSNVKEVRYRLELGT